MKIKPAAFAVALLLPLCLTACGGAPKEPPVPGKVLSGSEASKVRIEVFSDMQCPACRTLYIGTLQQLMEEYDDDTVSVIYYDFPLNMHEYARPAAQYASAAAKLGRRQLLSVFKVIYNDQAYWGRGGSLDDTVSQALSMEDLQKLRQILQDADSLAEINETIDKERQYGKQKDVNSTPTMFISKDGKEQKVTGSLSYQSLKLFLK